MHICMDEVRSFLSLAGFWPMAVVFARVAWMRVAGRL